jgi:integral membrane protein
MTTLTSGAIKRYRVMALFTGTMLLLLTFVVIPLQLWAHNKTLEKPVSIVHGYGYMVYLIVALDLCLRARYKPVRTILILLVGVVPFLAFYYERIVVRDTQRLLAEAQERAAKKKAKTSAKAARARTAVTVGAQAAEQESEPAPASTE